MKMNRGPPAIVSDPFRRGAILHYPRAEDDSPSQPTVYTLFQTSEPVLFSPLTDGIFEKKYKRWRTRHLELGSNRKLSSLYVRNRKVEEEHDLTVVTLARVKICDEGANVTADKIGIKVFCKKDGFETFFRCIITINDLQGLCAAIARVSLSHNASEMLNSLIPGSPDSVTATATSSGTGIDGVGLSGRYRSGINTMPGNNAAAASASAGGGGVSYNNNRSGSSGTGTTGGWIMKAASISAFRATWSMQRIMEKEEKIATRTMITKRRGAFKSLPVLFSNDLVHGSWWFLFGSLFITAVSALILWNSYNEVIGEDDSVLSPEQFRASWALLTASGVFFTVGSFAFVRAMNDPPMKPLFSCRHFMTDELFGSWMFLVAVIPGVPYSLIFLSIKQDLTFLALFVFALLSLLGSILFVRGSYPTDSEGSKSRLLSGLVCCCGRRGCLLKHFATDWLVGTWLVYWSTLLGTVGFALFTIYWLAEGCSNVAAFVNITTTLDCVFFLIGSAYFVAGSYPVDGQDDVIDVTARAIAEGAEQDRLDALMDLGRPLPVHQHAPVPVSSVNFNPISRMSHTRPTSPTTVGYTGIHNQDISSGSAGGGRGGGSLQEASKYSSSSSSSSTTMKRTTMATAGAAGPSPSSSSSSAAAATSVTGSGIGGMFKSRKAPPSHGVLISSDGVVINGVQVTTSGNNDSTAANVTSLPPGGVPAAAAGRTGSIRYTPTNNINTNSSNNSSSSGAISSNQYPLNPRGGGIATLHTAATDTTVAAADNNNGNTLLRAEEGFHPHHDDEASNPLTGGGATYRLC